MADLLTISDLVLETGEPQQVVLDALDRFGPAASGKVGVARVWSRSQLGAIRSSIRKLLAAFRQDKADQATPAVQQADALPRESEHALACQQARRLAAELPSWREANSSLAKQLQAETQARRVAQAAVGETRLAGHQQAAALRTELETLERVVAEQAVARSELTATFKQRTAQQAQQLAECEQARKHAQQRVTELGRAVHVLRADLSDRDARLKRESQRCAAGKAALAESRLAHQRDVAALRAEIKDLRREAAKRDAAARDSAATFEQRAAAQTKQLATSEQARQTAERQAASLDRTVQSLGERITIGEARLAAEMQRRSVAEAALAESRSARQTESAALRTEIEALRQAVAAGEAVRRELADTLAQRAAAASAARVESRRLREQAAGTARLHQQDLDRMAGEIKRLTGLRQQQQQQLAEMQAARDRLLAEMTELTAARAAAEDARVAAARGLLREELARLTRALNAAGAETKRCQQQLDAARQRADDHQARRRQAEAAAARLQQTVELLSTRAQALRSRLQREAAARRKAEAAVKREAAGLDRDSNLRDTRDRIESQQRIQRLTHELTALRQSESKLRRQAVQQLKKAKEEIQRLRSRLAGRLATAAA